jgi:hypothetical protein
MKTTTKIRYVVQIRWEDDSKYSTFGTHRTIQKARAELRSIKQDTASGRGYRLVKVTEVTEAVVK